ncbi:MAG: hypothetical protein PUB04_09145 [Clostridia bacterium]|nr:hypothetical protein [Clostridia bacterium]
MRNGHGSHQICIMNRIRNLWEQHVYWTRFFIISTASDLADLQYITNRLLENPKDFAEMLTPFYGLRNAKHFEELFTQHLTIGAELVNASKIRIKSRQITPV